MLKSNKLLRGTVVLSVGQVTGYGLSFLRNLLLARMLAKADYGLAAVFGMAVSLLEVSSRMAFGTQIIQSKHGDTEDFQASAHTLQFLGGTCSALLIAGTSIWVARLMGVEHTWWAFALLAVVPLSQGLTHLDMLRCQRNLDYLPSAISDASTQLLMTIAVWPLARWLGDYRVIVWLMIGKAVVGTSLSYSFAKRPYRWGWDRTHVHSMLKFGWPLLLTGLFIFGSQQVDQMIVGAVFSLQILANYALAFSLVSIPWFIFGQVMSSVMLPIMSRAQADPVRLRTQYQICALAAAVGGVICVLPLIISGEQIVILLYGTKYRHTGAFMAILGSAAAMRFLRYAPAIAAMAGGDTLNQLYSNIWRAMSLPLAFCVWKLNGTPIEIAACALVGETLAIVASIVRLRRQQGVPITESIRPALYMLVLISGGVAFALCAPDIETWVGIGAGVIGLLIAVLGAKFMFPDAARLLFSSIRRKSASPVPEPVTP